jgi:hypothetical protein
MTIEQTIEIPADRRIYIDLPLEFPVGKATVEATVIPVPESDRERLRKICRQTYGAWAANPWTDHLMDIHETWDDTDPWDPLVMEMCKPRVKKNNEPVGGAAGNG